VNKDRQLTRADDELGPVLDFILVTGEPPDQRVPVVVDPLDDVNQFAAKFVEQTHVKSPDAPSGEGRRSLKLE
jgi:hypothetical protein